MSDKPDKSMVVDGDTKTVVTSTGSHPWNNMPLPRIPKDPSYKYELTVKHIAEKEVKAVCSDLEELFAFHRQFVHCDYSFIKIERIEVK